MTKAEDICKTCSIHNRCFFEDKKRIESCDVIRGYRMAEKDLALTWRDIRKIIILLDGVCDEKGTHQHLNGTNIKEHCEEVLRRFTERRRR